MLLENNLDQLEPFYVFVEMTTLLILNPIPTRANESFKSRPVTAMKGWIFYFWGNTMLPLFLHELS